jgi:hypothetical protein
MNASRGYGRIAAVIAVAAAVAALAVLLGADRGVAAPETAAQAQYAPKSTKLPTVSGAAAVGQTLVAKTGSWEATSSVSYTYQWRRCDASGSNCDDIHGATNPEYKLTSDDVGHTVRVVVTARDSDGSTSAESAQTAKVAGSSSPSAPAGAVKEANGRISVPVTSLSLPDRLTVDGVKFSPSPVRSLTTISARFHVTDAKGYDVSGALVYGLGLPYSRVSDAAEVKTGTDGWATLQFQPAKFFPRKGFVVVFVRARKPGDDPLSGISTRRLVQVTVNR